MNNTLQQLMTPEEVADYLQVPIGTLYGWRCKRMGPVAVRIGRHLRYARSDVERWLEQCKLDAARSR